MNWTEEALSAVNKAPFFIRKRVKKRVEEEAARQGSLTVRLEHVHECRRRFLKSMEEEVRGYQVEQCFGPGGCPNRAVADEGISDRIQEVLAACDLKAFLRERVKGPLKFHHEIRISLSDCPNACSRPQIADIGFIGARRPAISSQTCSECRECVAVCREEAVILGSNPIGPQIDPQKCLACGQCLKSCPTGTLAEGERGYRLLLGGKLGRHPQLGRELGVLLSAAEVLDAVEACLSFYREHNLQGERLGEILVRTGFGPLREAIGRMLESRRRFGKG